MSLPPTLEKSLCIPYKMRRRFVLTVDLFVGPANPGEIVVYTIVPYEMRLGFILTVNWCRQTPEIPCFLS